jgi:hypothetical protein
MTTPSGPSTFRLILIPSVVTLLVSVLRIVGERQGWFPTKEGGFGVWLGIFFFGLLFAAWFAYRLRGAGSGPRVGRPWLWSLLALLPVFVAFGLTAPGLLDQEANEAGYAALRTSALAAIATASVAAIVQFVVWPRLAWTLLCYAVPARLTVIALTWIAKDNEWDTHYTKFGPKGWTFDMEGTMSRTVLMQLGFWVPFTIATGTLLGIVLFARRRAGAANA